MKYIILTILMFVSVENVFASEIASSPQAVKQSKKIEIKSNEDKCLDLGKKVIFENKQLTAKESDYWEKFCNKIKRDPKD